MKKFILATLLGCFFIISAAFTNKDNDDRVHIKIKDIATVWAWGYKVEDGSGKIIRSSYSKKNKTTSKSFLIPKTGYMTFLYDYQLTPHAHNLFTRHKVGCYVKELREGDRIELVDDGGMKFVRVVHAKKTFKHHHHYII